MQKLIFTTILVLTFTTACLAKSEPLLISFKTGAFVPDDGIFESTAMAGIEARFAINDDRVFVIEYSAGDAQSFTTGPMNGVSQTGSMQTETVSVGVLEFPDMKRGIYYGGGLAYQTFRISSVFDVSGDSYSVTTQPSRLAGYVTLGCALKQHYFVEAKYLYAGKKAWNPFSAEKTDLGGLSFNVGYRYAYK